MMKLSNLIPFDGEVYYIENVISVDKLSFFYESLLKNNPWENDKIKIYGKEITTKRKVAWFAENALPYQYSNQVKTPRPFSPLLLELKNLVQKFTSKNYNACLLNYYHDGSEYMGWHADNEKSIASNSSIASLSFGATRKFLFKHKTNQQKIQIILQPGSLLLMQGATQKYWKHSLPKAATVKNARINLTFRQMTYNQPFFLK